MNAPANEAKKFAARELPPTAHSTYSLGIKPSCPTRPSSRPAINTPKSSSGRIFLVKSQLVSNQFRSSGFFEVLVKKPIPRKPAVNAGSGYAGRSNARNATGIAVITTCHSGIPK